MPQRLALPSTRVRCATALGWKHASLSVQDSRETYTGIDPADGRRREIPPAVGFRADPDFHLRAELVLNKLTRYLVGDMPPSMVAEAALSLELVTIIDEAVTFALAVKPAAVAPPRRQSYKARRVELH